MSQVIVLFSGGLDSTTLVYHLRAEGHVVRALSADYGQRHREREASAAQRITQNLGIEHRTVDLRSLVGFFSANSLTDPSISVPAGEYSPLTMAQTLVPNRNMILLSIALAWAASAGCDAVAFGAHGGVYTPYPDCQPAFATAMHNAAQACHAPKLSVLAPFIDWSKADIVRRAIELGVPLADTWSCYQGEAVHCGECGTCLDRQQAFAESQIPDPTIYQPRV
jgi:7-cyano-7-deazaguanine synthase